MSAVVFIELISENRCRVNHRDIARSKKEGESISEWRREIDSINGHPSSPANSRYMWLFIRALVSLPFPLFAAQRELLAIYPRPIADVCKFTESLIAANFFRNLPGQKNRCHRSRHARPATYVPPVYRSCAHESRRTRVRSNGHINDQLSVWWKNVDSRGNSWFFICPLPKFKFQSASSKNRNFRKITARDRLAKHKLTD